DAGKAAETKVNFDDEVARYVRSGDEAKKAFSNLDQEVQKKLRDGLQAGKGRGGAGREGGKDGGKGTGEGDGVGPGTRKTSLTHALGVQLDVKHFVAFMPPQVEEKLFNIERNYRHLKEDDIYETKFKVRVMGGKYEPYVVEQTKKR